MDDYIIICMSGLSEPGKISSSLFTVSYYRKSKAQRMSAAQDCTAEVFLCLVACRDAVRRPFLFWRRDNMIYTALTKKAMLICYRAHHGQYDRTGLPYVFHPYHLAEQMEDEYSTVAALLHDVVEDTDITFEELEGEGFPDEVMTAVRLLTHSPEVPYYDYVRGVIGNPIAEAVKLADLRHNSDLSRLDTVTEHDLERQRKYLEAIRILTENKK